MLTCIILSIKVCMQGQDNAIHLICIGPQEALGDSDGCHQNLSFYFACYKFISVEGVIKLQNPKVGDGSLPANGEAE